MMKDFFLGIWLTKILRSLLMPIFRRCEEQRDIRCASVVDKIKSIWCDNRTKCKSEDKQKVVDEGK